MHGSAHSQWRGEPASQHWPVGYMPPQSSPSGVEHAGRPAQSQDSPVVPPLVPPLVVSGMQHSRLHPPAESGGCGQLNSGAAFAPAPHPPAHWHIPPPGSQV